MRRTALLSILALWACGGAPHEPVQPMEEQAAAADQEPNVPENEPAPVIPEEPGAEVEPEPGQPAIEEADEPAVPEPEPLTGTIVSRKGKVLTVTVDQAPPEAGAEGTLLKYFEKQILGMHTTGWLDIAAVKVKQVKENQLQLVIVEEHSQMTVNNKKVNHFQKGTTVKLEFN
jgi:hypothetical protein